MKFGLRYCNTGRYVDPALGQELVQAGEAAGFESAWTVEHTVVPANYTSTYPYSGDGKMAGGVTKPNCYHIDQFEELFTLNGTEVHSRFVDLIGRLHHFLLLPWGLAGALVGGVLWRRSDGRLVADLWLAALVAFVLVAGEANISHEYYQLPFVPLAGLYFGAAVGPLIDVSRASRGRARSVALALALTIVGVAGFYYSGVILTHFRPDNLDLRLLESGRAVERVVPGDALMIVVDDYGVTSPLLLFFAHRKGWSFDPEDLYPQVIDGLRRKGARYFATTAWSRVEEVHPDTAMYLKTFPRVPTDGAPGNVAVFDLTDVTR